MRRLQLLVALAAAARVGAGGSLAPVIAGGRASDTAVALSLATKLIVGKVRISLAGFDASRDHCLA